MRKEIIYLACTASVPLAIAFLRFCVLPALRARSIRMRLKSLKQSHKPRPAWIAWLSF